MMRFMTWGLGLLLTVAAGAWAGEPLRLDKATAAELAEVPGVGPDVAQQIVALRDARHEIHSVEELRVIPGISEQAIDTLRATTAIQFSVAVGAAPKFASAAEVLSRFDHEPTVVEVQAWTSEYAKTRPEVVDRWLRASRAFAALPEVKVVYQLNDDYKNTFRRYDVDGNPPTSNDAPAFDVQTDADVGQSRTVYVYATWQLDRLIMSSEQIRVINEAQDIVKLREKVLSEVTRLYFERRRLQVDMLMAPKSDLMGQVKDELRLRELTANIDAYTGGEFSDAVSKAKPPPPLQAPQATPPAPQPAPAGIPEE